MDTDDEESSFNEKLSLADIGDLADMCKERCGIKYVSVLLYLALRYFNVSWESIDECLKKYRLYDCTNLTQMGIDIYERRL